jgi:hypothetical protein
LVPRWPPWPDLYRPCCHCSRLLLRHWLQPAPLRQLPPVQALCASVFAYTPRML